MVFKMKKENRLKKKRSFFNFVAVIFFMVWLDGAAYEISAFSGTPNSLFAENRLRTPDVTLNTAWDDRSLAHRNTMSNEDEIISNVPSVDVSLVLKKLESNRKFRAWEGHDVKIHTKTAGIKPLAIQKDVGTVLPVAGIAMDQTIGRRNNWIIAFGLGFYYQGDHNARVEPNGFFPPAFKVSEQKSDSEHLDLIDKIVNSLPCIRVVVKYKF